MPRAQRSTQHTAGVLRWTKEAVFLSLVHGTASEPARRLVKCADSRALLQNGLNQHRSGEGKNAQGQKTAVQETSGVQGLLRYKSYVYFQLQMYFLRLSACTHLNHHVNRGTGISGSYPMGQALLRPLTYLIPLNPSPLTHKGPSTNVETDSPRG